MNDDKVSRNVHSLYIPYKHKEYPNSIIVKLANDIKEHTAETFAVPPKELMEYGETTEKHLKVGKATVDIMRSVVSKAGYNLSDSKRILEFGCSNGRLMRQLVDLTPKSEIWGVDIQSDKIIWAIENLSPTFNFAINTTVPHLPFKDGYFDFIYAGSLFTHINELHISWLLELSRLLSPQGLLYVTVNDEAAVEYMSNNPQIPSSKRLNNHLLGKKVFTENYDFVSIFSESNKHDSILSLVVMSSEYLHRITKGVLDLVSVTPNAYSMVQTGYLFCSK